MDGHEADPLDAFFDEGLVLLLSVLGESIESAHEASKREAARVLEAARKLHQPEHVREHLVSGLPKRKARLGARGIEQLPDGERDRTVISVAVQLRQDVHGGANSLVPVREVGAQLAKRVESAVSRAIEKQILVGDAEQRTAQGRKHGELVIGPLDGGQGDAHGLDLFALIETASAHQNVRNVPGGKLIHVRLSDAVASSSETTEEKADVRRANGPRLIGSARRDLPAALLDEPLYPGCDRLGLGLLDCPLANVAPTIRAGNRKGDEGWS
jgi:hypothetical protein